MRDVIRCVDFTIGLSQLQTQQVMTSLILIRPHIEYLIQTHYIIVFVL